MPNALILEYQKSRIRHAPSHLRPPECATCSFVKVIVFNAGSALQKKDTQVTTLTRISSLTHDNAAIAT
jgi:hypothetical protein